jgi:hypothetical protein
MLKTKQLFGTKTVSNLAKDIFNKGVYHVNKTHTFPSNNVIYGYKPKLYYSKDSIYNKNKFNYFNKLGKLGENQPFPSHISLGILKSVQVLPPEEYIKYSQEKFGYKKNPKEIKDKISEKKYEELVDINNKMHIINNVYLIPYTGLTNYKLKLTPQQVLKEYDFYTNTTDFRMQVIKQKMVELGLASENEIKNFELNVKLSESQIDEYYKFMEMLDNKELVNKITIEEFKSAFKNTIIYIKKHFKISNNLLYSLNNNFKEVIKMTESNISLNYILSLFNFSKLIKKAKLLKEYLKNLNNYLYNIIIENSLKIKNKIIENFKRIVEFFKTINKKGVETKYSTEFYELLESPFANKEELNTKLKDLVLLIEKNNLKEFKGKALNFMIYINKSHKFAIKEAYLLMINDNLFNRLLIKQYEKIFKLNINKDLNLLVEKKGIKIKNESYMSLIAIYTMNKLLKF